MKYFFCATMMISFLIHGSMFSMHKMGRSGAGQVMPSLMIRHCSSKNNKDQGVQPDHKRDSQDVLKHLKESLGVKSDFIFYAYLGTLFCCALLPKPRSGYDRYYRKR